MYRLAVNCICSVVRILRYGNTIGIAIPMISRLSRYHRNGTALNTSTTFVPDGVDALSKQTMLICKVRMLPRLGNLKQRYATN